MKIKSKIQLWYLYTNNVIIYNKEREIASFLKI